MFFPPTSPKYRAIKMEKKNYVTQRTCKLLPRNTFLFDITSVQIKLWPLKDNGVVRPLPALSGVIANALQCNECVRACKVAGF